MTRAKDRMESMKAQIEKLQIKNVHWYPAFDGKDLTNDTFSIKINLPQGQYCYRRGEALMPADIGVVLSHIGAISMAKSLDWEHVIIIEDDVHIAEDFEKRINSLFKMLPKDWEHVFLSGIPHLTQQQKNDPLLTKFMNLIPDLYTDTTYGYIIKNTAYEKTLKALRSLGTTIDDLYGNFIFENKGLKSYSFFPYVICANLDIESQTYVGKMPAHPSITYFKNKL